MRTLLFVTLWICIIPIRTLANTGVSVTDLTGREITLKKPAQRVVALAPHIVENIYSAGAGDFIVGAVDYCDYPEQAKTIPRVGAISTFSVEAIVALKPDIVVIWHSGKGANILSKLESLGVPVYASAPHTLEDIPKLIRDYGILFNSRDTAEPVAISFEEKLIELKNRYQNTRHVPTFYQVWSNPLQTLNGDHIISDVISMCGGNNIFSDSPIIAPKVSIESVLRKNPSAIITSGIGKARPEYLNDWKQWKSLDAVKHNNLFHVPPDILQRHTVRLLEGAELVCDKIAQARSSMLDN